MLHNQATWKNNLRLRWCATKTEVFCDFDGTITCVDATDAVLETFALPAWCDWEQRWVNGNITSQECLSRRIEVIRTDRDTLIRFAANLTIDEGIIALDLELFDTLWEVKLLTARWRQTYNQIRPHSALGYRPPAPEAMPHDVRDSHCGRDNQRG